MANIDLIKHLNIKYEKDSPIARSSLASINEAFDPNKIEKAIQDSIIELGPDYALHFEYGLNAEVALLFIDICNFSTRFPSLKGNKLSAFFDEYYDLIIPKIYKHGGEIDKVIGDGIICVFGPPFIKGSQLEIINKSHECAKEIILATESSLFSSKVAFHIGEINYFKNKSQYYKEFTIVGKPLTELFRLESVSKNECLNYYEGTPISDLFRLRLNASVPINRDGINNDRVVPNWNHNKERIQGLAGVSYKYFFYANHIEQ